MCFTISSPEAAILLVCTRNQDLWAKLKARQKDRQSSLAVETCSFQPQSPTHAQNQTGTRISWFRFWIRPEPLRFPTAGQGDAGSGDEIDVFTTCRSENNFGCQHCRCIIPCINSIVKSSKIDAIKNFIEQACLVRIGEY